MNTRRVDLLHSIRDRIASGWCQRYWAVDRNGLACSANDADATAWCLSGAFHAGLILPFQPLSDSPTWWEAIDRITATIREEVGADIGMIAYNDAPGRTQEDILRLLDRAIVALAQ